MRYTELRIHAIQRFNCTNNNAEVAHEPTDLGVADSYNHYVSEREYSDAYLLDIFKVCLLSISNEKSPSQRWQEVRTETNVRKCGGSTAGHFTPP